MSNPKTNSATALSFVPRVHDIHLQQLLLSNRCCHNLHLREQRFLNFCSSNYFRINDITTYNDSYDIRYKVKYLFFSV